jgi:CoA:oxalate CoA-transferase
VLEHLRIVELGQVIAGTFGGMILADLGAEVVKVEPPTGDAGRRGAIYGIGDDSAIHLTHNRNKRSVVLDLKVPAGRQALLDLVAAADVVVENFRPGVMERLGIGFDDLRAVNDDVVLVSVSGFGRTSPYREAPAYDLILQAMSGHMAIMGEPDRPPVIMGIPIADLLAGVFAAVAVLAGVASRDRTGSGRHLDVAMLDVMVEMLAHVGTLYLNTGTEQEPQGSSHPFITPWQAFRCGDGAYVVVAPREEHFWRRLATAIGRPDLADDPAYADARSRQANRDVLLPLLDRIFAERPAAAWLADLAAAGVPASPVNRMSEVFADPHVQARSMVVEYPGTGVRAVGNAIKVVDGEDGRVSAPPELGADTLAVLGSLPGYDEARLAELAASGALGPAPAGRPRPAAPPAGGPPV